MEHLESVARQNVRRIYLVIYGYLSFLSIGCLSRSGLAYGEAMAVILMKTLWQCFKTVFSAILLLYWRFAVEKYFTGNTQYLITRYTRYFLELDYYISIFHILMHYTKLFQD